MRNNGKATRVSIERTPGISPSRTLALLSFELVMKYVRSGLTCKSVTNPAWFFSLDSISSPFLASHSATLPDSWPERMHRSKSAKATT